MIYFVRHGERADFCHKEKSKIINRDDPHLTTKGCTQAQEAGKKILKSFKQFREINVQSSPFLRCIMTAQNIVNEIKCNKLTIKTEISESLYDYLYESDPQPNLLYNTNSDHTLFQTQKIDYVDEQVNGLISYPETFHEVNNRILEYTKQILKTLKHDECVILVTHQRPLKTILEYFDIDSSNVGYCQIIQLKKKDESLDKCGLQIF